MWFFYRGFLIISFIFSLALFCSLLFIGTEGIVYWIISILELEDKAEKILPIMLKMPLAPGAIAAGVCALLSAFAYFKERIVIRSIKRFFFYWKEAFRNLFASLSTCEILIISLIPLLSSIYFASVIAVSYDEASTYNYFTSKPFYYCMIFYPYPNNHVLHSLVTNFTDYFSFLGILFAMRIPAIVSSVFAWLIGYSFLKKYYSSRVAILVVGLASVMYMSIFYSFMSRGYAFIVLAFVVCMYASFNIIKKGSRTKDWMFFVIAGILGCYAIPSFLYAFATLNFLILVYNFRNIKQQIVANLIAGSLILLLYAPIMIVDSVAALTSNSFMQHIERIDILKGIFLFYRAMFADIAGVPYWVILSVFIPLGFTIHQKDKWHLSLWIIFMLAPFVLLMFHAVNPFYRTFLYYNFILMFLMVVPFKQYLEKISKKVILILILLLQLASVYSFDQRIRVDEGFNTNVALISDQYFNESDSIVFPCIASENFIFEAKIRGLKSHIHFWNNTEANVDTINTYQYVIIEKRYDKTILKTPVFSSEQQNIYKNR